MKNLIFLLLIVACNTYASAQFLLGGQISFSSYSNNTELGTEGQRNGYTNLNLSPRAAYVNGNMWYGLDAGITLYTMEYVTQSGGIISRNEVKQKEVSIAPFVRYIYRPAEHIGIWLEGQAGIDFGDAHNKDGEKIGDIFGYSAGIRPGIIIFVNSHLSLDASFGRLAFSSQISTDPRRDNYKDTTNNFGLFFNGVGLFGANWRF